MILYVQPGFSKKTDLIKLEDDIKTSIPILFKGRISCYISLGLKIENNCPEIFLAALPKIKDKVIVSTFSWGYLFYPFEDKASFATGMKQKYQEILDQELPSNCSPKIFYRKFLFSGAKK